MNVWRAPDPDRSQVGHRLHRRDLSVLSAPSMPSRSRSWLAPGLGLRDHLDPAGETRVDRDSRADLCVRYDA